MKTFTSPTQRKGELGENIACKFLNRKGFKIIERNFTRKWGEIDVVATKDGVLHFVEVKSVTYENPLVRPEENVNKSKQKKLARIIETYIRINEVERWVFDVLVVIINIRDRVARVSLIEDTVTGN